MRDLFAKALMYFGMGMSVVTVVTYWLFKSKIKKQNDKILDLEVKGIRNEAEDKVANKTRDEKLNSFNDRYHDDGS